MSIGQLQVPGCCKHDNPALGGYIIWSVQFLLVTGMNNIDFFKSGSIYIEASLKPSLCSAQDLGATGNMHIRRNIFKFSVLSKPDLPGVCNNYDPASVTIMTRCHPYLQTGNFGNIKPASFTSSNRLNIR